MAAACNDICGSTAFGWARCPTRQTICWYVLDTWTTRGLPWGIRCDAGDYFLLYDQVGSLRVVADAAGKVIQEIEYDTFGSILRETGEGFVLPFGFAGGLHDRDTGLVCFGVRDYLPELGRFMAKDPLGLKGGDPDVYGYCLDDPVNRVDPSGMSWEDILNAGSAIASGCGQCRDQGGRGGDDFARQVA